ncbi:MAG: nucleotidyl transferase AbiEii/AbiGii toxin family protein [Candidatus Hydrogenedentes bacterium]|nr:nucleotidyl transferase AbiEii/AbiGii toxin family protein [Candidatus Hydrogenedentota bacterium]
MIEVIRAAAELQAFCEERRWRSCIIGGLALQRWGEPRETVDVDLTLLTGFGDEGAFVAEFLQHYEPRIEDAAQFALSRRVLLLKTGSGVGLDIALGGLPFEESCIERATFYEFPGAKLRTCSAEDLIVMKAFASRPKDWIDVEGILVRQSGRLDWTYIVNQLRPLVELKETPEILTQLQEWRRRSGA